MQLTSEHPLQGQGLLYPMMVIAAIAVIVFSIVGIATVTGWMPRALIGDAVTVESGSVAETTVIMPDAQRTGPAFQCVECGVIESVREIERRSAAHQAPLANMGRRIPAAGRAQLF
ncbi:MAG TPA: hypothetical protein VM164_13690 [Burkholderiales bacterium]|nr:hypothetical protein [Burkholderiales bacterium]